MNTQSAKPDALRARRAIASGPLKDRLLALYRLAAAGAYRDSAGRTWPDLTDYEAAAGLEVERTSVNAARNELVKAGLVVKCRRRRCRYKPSGQDVWGWRLAPTADVGQAMRDA